MTCFSKWNSENPNTDPEIKIVAIFLLIDICLALEVMVFYLSVPFSGKKGSTKEDTFTLV